MDDNLIDLLEYKYRAKPDLPFDPMAGFVSEAQREQPPGSQPHLNVPPLDHLLDYHVHCLSYCLSGPEPASLQTCEGEEKRRWSTGEAKGLQDS